MAEEFTILKQAKGYFEDKKSQFHSFLLPIKDKASINDFIYLLRKEHQEMCHFCYAARYRNPILTELCFDDGEPNGTAGRPILNVLQMSLLIDCGCVVMRKFGGTLLGKGGLTKAYSQATSNALINSIIGKMVKYVILEGEFTYPQWSRIERTVLVIDAKPEILFLETIHTKISVSPESAIELQNEIIKSLNGFYPFKEVGVTEVFVRT